MAEVTGALLKRWRLATIDPTTGRPYTQESLGEAIGVSASAIGAMEKGAIASIAPEHANKLSRLLSPLSVADICRAMGYEVESGALNGEESEVVQILRRVPDDRRSLLLDVIRAVAKGALGTYARQAPVRYRVREPQPTSHVADRD